MGGCSQERVGQGQVGKVGRQVGGVRRQLDRVGRGQELCGVRRQSSPKRVGQ